MIFYLLGILSYYKLSNKSVPAGICLLFFGVLVVPPAASLMLLLNKHWIFRILALAGGFFCWTFIEYFIHRFLLHKVNLPRFHNWIHPPGYSIAATTFYARLKRSVLLITAVLSVYYSIMYSYGIVLPAGLFSGYVLCRYMSVWLHRAWTEKWFRKLHDFHRYHYQGDTGKCFGITTSLWDKLFNTLPVSNSLSPAKSKGLLFFRKYMRKSEAGN